MFGAVAGMQHSAALESAGLPRQSGCMSNSWKVTFACTRAEAEALTGDLEFFAAMDAPPTLIAQEPDESRPDAWEVSAYFEGQPDPDLVARIHAELRSNKGVAPLVEQLPETDWVTLSQQGLDPVSAGRFFVHVSHFDGPIPQDSRAFVIDASLAFGTGGHATTAGCLTMLDRLARSGHRFSHIADIGTGTGLLAFAAAHLWPRARIIASDIDPVSVRVAGDNAQINDVPLGHGVGHVELVTASGTDHSRIRRRAPYDLIIANILAGPLIELAPAFAALMADGGNLILAGLLDRQREAVTQAYAAAGLRVAETQPAGDWPCLRLTKRTRHGWRRPLRSTGRTSQAAGDFGTW